MTRPEDVALLGLLESQLRELGFVLSRLETMRSTLVPAPADFWRGATGRAYEERRASLAAAVATGIFRVEEARDNTAAAVQQVAARV